MKIDNFALSMFQTCPIKYKLRMHEGWTGRRKSAALGFGATLHEGLAAWYRTGSKSEALVAISEHWPANHPIDDFRSKEKCISVMVDYMKTYSTESFKVIGYPENPMVECTFTLDTGMRISCVKCGPILGKYKGYYDIVGKELTLVNDHPLCPTCGQPLETLEYGGIFDTLIDFSNSV